MVKQDYKNLLVPKGMYQFFECTSSGNEIELFSKAGATALAKFKFPRQRKENGLCLADYVNPFNPKHARDNMAMFVVTCGEGVRATSEKLKDKGDYLRSHVLQALAIESAEAFAEVLHSQIRKMWGFPDPVDLSMTDRFQAKYKGKRYSFGYPACPDLNDQRTLFRLLQPQDIGVDLTEECMMDPEASVSAIVFHHPQAIYFAAGN
jgi:5-methyltetrahydrofolate--homocysteine methyltransferase